MNRWIAPSLARRLAVAAGALLLAITVAALVMGSAANGHASPPHPSCPWMTPLAIKTVTGGTPLYIWDNNDDGTADGYSLATPLPCLFIGGLRP
jgi:predicted lipoprotein with Yx(FWY)xxD motif